MQTLKNQMSSSSISADQAIDSAISGIVEKASTSNKKIEDIYKYWQTRVLYSLVFGYAAYYFIRVIFSVAAPSMSSELGYTRTDLGLVMTIGHAIYGIGKSLNGYLGDRSNPRSFMTIGLIFSALTAFVMPLGEGILYFCIIWGMSSWFQSMGWPPISKSLTHWFPPTQLGTVWGIANTSIQIGGALSTLLVGYLIISFGWQSAFYIPPVLSLITAFFLYERLRDTPRSLGLPSIEVKEGLVQKEEHLDEEDEPLHDVIKKVFSNKLIWCVCLGNMFLYVVRMGVVNWGPLFLGEYKGASLTSSCAQVAAFEIAGMLGGIAAGWISDKLFRGRRGPVSCIFMVALIACLLLFWYAPVGYDTLNGFIMFIAGIFVYGPQALVGVAAADIASKRVVGMAVGITGTFGYLGSSAISGVGIGWIVDHFGWDIGIAIFIGSAILSLLCFAMTWNTRAKVLEKA